MKYIVKYTLDQDFMNPECENHPIACAEKNEEVENLMAEALTGMEVACKTEISPWRHFMKGENGRIVVFDVVNVAGNAPIECVVIQAMEPVFLEKPNEPDPVWIPYLRKIVMRSA